jgi:hypothetical protein
MQSLRMLLPLLLLALSACGVRDPAAEPGVLTTAPGCASAMLVPTSDPRTSPAASEPTTAPEPTAPPAPLPSPPPTEDVPPPEVPYDALAATAVAVATAQPFPTAPLPAVQGGTPAASHGSRGNLALTVSLPSDELVAGEAAEATLTLSNGGSEPLVIGGNGKTLGWLQVQDEWGSEAEAWPWVDTPRPGGVSFLSLAPGQTISATLTLQTPPADLAQGHSYALWAATSFAREIPGTGGSDNIWLHLEAGPIPLTLAPPRPEHQIAATLAVDAGGWQVRAHDANGQPVVGAWGAIEAGFLVDEQFSGFSSGLLGRKNTGAWSGSWDPQMRPEQARIAVRAWVGAPGHVTAVLTETTGNTPMSAEQQAHAFWEGALPCRQTFADAAAAHQVLGLPIAELRTLPAGAALRTVQAEITPGWVTLTTQVELANSAWLTLVQRSTTEQYEGAGWGEARSNAEARVVPVGGETGYLILRYGLWVLNWKVGAVVMELRAPAAALSPEELARLAAQVEVQE